MDADPMVTPPLCQARRGSLAPVPEGVGGAGKDLAGPEPIPKDLIQPGLRRHPRELEVERQHQDNVYADLLEQLEALVHGGQQDGLRAGPQHLKGVGLEGHDDRMAADGARAGDRAADDLPVSQVEAVERPEGKDRISEIAGELIEAGRGAQPILPRRLPPAP